MRLKIWILWRNLKFWVYLPTSSVQLKFLFNIQVFHWKMCLGTCTKIYSLRKKILLREQTYIFCNLCWKLFFLIYLVDLRSRIKFKGLKELRTLRQLYLSQNGIREIIGLENCEELEVLDLNQNRLEAIQNISHLIKLTDFWAKVNKVRKFRENESWKFSKGKVVRMERSNICCILYFYRIRKTKPSDFICYNVFNSLELL